MWRLARLLMYRGHRARDVLDGALADAGLSAPNMLETSVPALAQGIAAAGRGIAVRSDDPLFNLRTIPITLRGTELMLTLYGVWDPDHYAASAIRTTLEAIKEFSQRSGAEIFSTPTSNFRGLAPALTETDGTPRQKV